MDAPREAHVRELRAEILEHLRLQHQLLVVAVALGAAGVTLLARDASPPAEVVLGISLLFLSIAFAMLRHDQMIVVIATFLSDGEGLGPFAAQWREWELFLGERDSRWWSFLPGVSQYAIPVFGAIAAAGLYWFEATASRWWLIVPVVALVAFLASAVETMTRYSELRSP